jgi:hypothetical protein
MSEEGTEGDRRIGRNRRDDVLDRGEQCENGVNGGGRKLRQPRQQGFYQRASRVATAITAIPSPRPIKPIPSLLLALRLTAPGRAPT